MALLTYSYIMTDNKSHKYFCMSCLSKADTEFYLKPREEHHCRP